MSVDDLEDIDFTKMSVEDEVAFRRMVRDAESKHDREIGAAAAALRVATQAHDLERDRLLRLSYEDERLHQSKWAKERQHIATSHANAIDPAVKAFSASVKAAGDAYNTEYSRICEEAKKFAR